MLAGPVAAVGAHRLRKRRARAARRSPISCQLLREPGHTLRLRVEEANIDLQWDVSQACVLPVALAAAALAQAHVAGFESAIRLAPLYALLAVAVVAYTIRNMWKRGQKLDLLRAGLDGEV